MDSPSDLSPNAPPAGFEDSFKNIGDNTNKAVQAPASTEGSIDSSGFEKIEHDPLEEYGHNFAQQMHQSIFGQLPDDPDGHEDDFVIIPSQTQEQRMEGDLVLPDHTEKKPYSSPLDEELSTRHTPVHDEKEMHSPSKATPSLAPRSKETTPEIPAQEHTAETYPEHSQEEDKSIYEHKNDKQERHSQSPEHHKENSPIPDDVQHKESSPVPEEAIKVSTPEPGRKELSPPLHNEDSFSHEPDRPSLDHHHERTPSPVPEKERSPSPNLEKQHTPSPVEEKARTPSPVQERPRTPSPDYEKARTPSPVQAKEHTPSPIHEKERSVSPPFDHESSFSPVHPPEQTPYPEFHKGENPVHESKEPSPPLDSPRERSPSFDHVEHKDASPVAEDEHKGHSSTPEQKSEESPIHLHKEESVGSATYNPYSEETIKVQHEEPLHEEKPVQHQDSFAMDAKHLTNLEDHHHVPSDGGDLIDIPHNVSPPRDTEYHHDPHDYAHHDLGRSDPSLIPEPISHDHKHHHHKEPEVHHEYRLPEPDRDEERPEPISYQHEPGHHHHPVAEDVDIGQQAKELVGEAIREAGDKMQHYKEATHVDDGGLAEEVQEQVDSLHNEVDDVLDLMHDDNFKEVVKNQTKESDEEPEPDFRRTPESEERPYERHGPLIIPEIPDHQEDELLEDVPVPPHHSHHGFETEPRPPTPPKDISDEDVKPSLVNLGHGHPTHSHSDSHHSILKHSSGNAEPWVDFKKVDPCVLDIVYWHDPKKSGIALALSLLAVFIFAKYPILSILSYSGLAVLAGTLGFRLFKAVEAQIKKTGGENPFQEYLNKDLNIPQDKAHAQVDVLVDHGVQLLNKAKKLIFVENIFESVKFVLLLWSMTYVSAWFSGFALVLITVLGIFTIPKVYETYQEPIDQQLSVISGHINNVAQLIQEKLPFLKRQHAEVEKKEQ